MKKFKPGDILKFDNHNEVLYYKVEVNEIYDEESFIGTIIESTFDDDPLIKIGEKYLFNNYMFILDKK